MIRTSPINIPKKSNNQDKPENKQNKKSKPNKTDKSDKNTPIDKIYNWVPDELVDKCSGCSSLFSFMYRKHHCRCCGRIFCFNCSSFNIVIPENFSLLVYQIDKAERVCKTCFDKITSFNITSALIEGTSLFKLAKNPIVKQWNEYILHDIEILNKLSLVSKTWKNYSSFKLAKFRELQYVLPKHKYTKLEKDLLWHNRVYIIKHPKYCIQLLKSINYNSYSDVKYKLNQIIELLKQDIKVDCEKIYCTRLCNKYNSLLYEDVIELLTENIKHIDIRRYALNTLDVCPDIIPYIPFLVYVTKFDVQDETIDFLISKSNNLEISNEIFWDLTLYTEQSNESNKTKDDNKTDKNKYKYSLDKFTEKIKPEFLKEILQGKQFTESLKQQEVYEMKTKLACLSNIKCPVDINAKFNSIDTKNAHIKPTASSPLLLPFNQTNNQKEKVNILFKYEDIRKDQIILNMIKLIKDILLKEEKINLNITTYKVRPTSCKSGYIEIVPDSHTIKYINTELSMSVLNFIMDNNKKKTVEEIRTTFLNSCAAYCVITYIFGIGDRHLDNIMLTKSGVLFHIDYGFILGDDPKPLNKPMMRIPSDIVDALGGIKGEYYQEFINMCNKIYNCIRRHINLFINMLSVLSNSVPPVINPEPIIVDELIKRFIPGEHYKQAEIQLYSVIKSSSETHTYNLYDMIHHYHGTLVTKGGIWNTIVSLF